MSTNMATGKSGCGCGCGGQCTCESRCCDLECLTRPNFYCGQLLTDADLSAMIEWTRKRLALSRYRDGWGVVCGLDLSCGAPGENVACCGEAKASAGPAVYLSAGYALDCCGNDLVVCEPMRVDLRSVCRPPDDPCQPQPPQQIPPRSGNTPIPGVPAGAENECFNIDTNSLVAVQVYLRYHEELAQGQRAMFRGGGECGSTEACEYARVLERPCIHLEVVPLQLSDDDDEESEEERWVREFRDSLRRKIKELSELAQKRDPDAVLQYLRANPPFQLCYLKELVCCLRDSKKFDEQAAVSTLILLLQDWVLRQLQCGCFSCSPDKGVPLGVVILKRTTEGRRTTCSVFMIDSKDRYRRWIQRQMCQLLHARDYNLLRYLGQSQESAKAQLNAAGMKVETQDWSKASVADLDAFSSALDKQRFVADPADPKALRLHVVTDPMGVRRVIALE